jgi:hypothetical protein
MNQAIFRWAEKIYYTNREMILSSLQRRRNLHINLPVVELPKAVMNETECCFVLSTGRCGTDLLTRILEKHPMLEAQHQPKPELIYLSKIAYLEVNQNKENWRAAALHARYDLLEDCFMRGIIYVETNNRITFYAPYLAELFPRSRFIHLIRDPRDFVRSGLRRGYYTGVKTDIGRIVPRVDSPVADKWLTISQISKIAWLWNETNAFIENFKDEISNERVMTVFAEDLFTNVSVSESIYNFIGITPPSRQWLAKRISKPTNIQKIGDISSYIKWTEIEKNQLREWSSLASYYNYII